MPGPPPPLLQGNRPWGFPLRPMPLVTLGDRPPRRPLYLTRVRGSMQTPSTSPGGTFAERGNQANHLHVGHAGNGEAGFMGAAAMFTVDQFLQRAR
ncbi:hypothetical protein PG997_004020 [Apiospora hydei]|uniref:Uncharacterized protein n=1 Tax=Apiospora hydei TaxID=1337664 RepID=A0ABR1X117_9PEZI